MARDYNDWEVQIYDLVKVLNRDRFTDYVYRVMRFNDDESKAMVKLGSRLKWVPTSKLKVVHR